MSETELILDAIRSLESRVVDYEQEQRETNAAIYKHMAATYVTCKEFDPVKAITYGFVGLILVAVVVALLSLVVL